jgi:hypothetical protein
MKQVKCAQMKCAQVKYAQLKCTQVKKHKIHNHLVNTWSKEFIWIGQVFKKSSYLKENIVCFHYKDQVVNSG